MSSIDRLKGFLAQDPDNPEIACELFDLQFAAGDIAAAGDVISSLSPQARQQPGIRFRTSRIALVRGEYEKASDILNELNASGHESVVLAHDLAFAALCLKQTVRAIAIIDQALERYEATSELHVLRARIALMEGRYDTAQEYLELALVLRPGDATALGVRALAYLDSGEASAARQAATSCLGQYPDQHEALLVAGTTCLWEGDLPAASAHYQRVLTRFPNSGRALSGLGQVKALAGDLELAEKLLEQAANAMPEHIGSWHALGWMRLLRGDLEGAGVCYRKAHDLDRNFAESHGGLAVVAMLEGRVDEGEASMKRALKLDAHCVSGRYAKSLWLRQSGRPAESDALFGELMTASGLPGLEKMQMGELAARLRNRALPNGSKS